MTKICSTCKVEYDVSEFSKNKSKKDGLSSQCKHCVCEYRNTTKEQRAEYCRKYREEHLDDIKKYEAERNKQLWQDPEYRQKNKDYRANNKEHIKQRAKSYNKKLTNTEEYKLHRRTYYSKNKEHIREVRKEHRKNNAEKIRKQELEYIKNNPERKIYKLTLRRISDALKNNAKSGHTLELLNVSSNEYYRKFLEDQFTSDMSWTNHGKVWEIDHIIPLNLFNLTDPDEQYIGFNHLNTRPLSKFLNGSRSKISISTNEKSLILERGLKLNNRIKKLLNIEVQV